MILIAALLFSEIPLFFIIIHILLFFCVTRPYIPTRLTLVLLTLTIASVVRYVRLLFSVSFSLQILLR
jgi:hypothetical protein